MDQIHGFALDQSRKPSHVAGDPQWILAIHGQSHMISTDSLQGSDLNTASGRDHRARTCPGDGVRNLDRAPFDAALRAESRQHLKNRSPAYICRRRWYHRAGGRWTIGHGRH